MNDQNHSRHVSGLSGTELIVLHKLADLIAYRVEHKTADVRMNVNQFEMYVREETEILIQVLDGLMDDYKNVKVSA
jgi:hypothetical protein